MNNVRINCGVGDILLSRAVLDGQQGVVGVSLGEEVAAHERGPDYLGFAKWLFGETFAGFAPASEGSPRLDPPGICRLTGLLPRWPRLPRSNVDGGYIVVTTKVRGIHRRIYERLRSDFVDVIRTLALSRRVYLVGEKEVGKCAEYDHHGEDLVYSIYGDLFQIDGVTDMTVQELGRTAPTPQQFRIDANIMASAHRVVTIGTGGNTSMAMAAGRCWSFVGHGEYEEYFSRMPWRPAACSMFDHEDDFLGGLL